MRTFIVASFTLNPFTGNPAGVCLLEEAASDSEMQAIATELRQPETAFLLGEGQDRPIRWFSPEVEIDLCGHATLAAAHVLWETGQVDRDRPLSFASQRKGVLTATKLPDGPISMDFPASFGAPREPDTSVIAAIDAVPISAALFSDRWVFEFKTADQVRGVRPDFAALKATGARSLFITAPSDQDEYDIISRNFAPIVGVNEDQVTGAAHTCLATYWQSRLGNRLRCWQASQRGGGMITELLGDRVMLQGQARIEFTGTFLRNGPGAVS